MYCRELMATAVLGWRHRVLATGSLVLVALAIVFAPVATVNGAEPAAEIDYPLVVFNAASIQRLRDNAGVMFESAERKDMTDRVDQWMIESLKETKGIDRSRPFGIMFYLRAGSFLPQGISYLPVTSLDDVLAIFAGAEGKIVPVEGKPNRHEIRHTENFKSRTLYRNGYLFIAGPDGDDTSLDREFPDPEKLTSRLTAQYDIAISLLINTIPVGLKTVFLAFLKNQTQAELQQRDNEPESVYRLRRANGEFWLDLLEKIVNQGNEVTLGTRFESEEKLVRIELEVAGTRDSKLAKFFHSMAGKKTYFGNLISDSATMTASLSLVLEEQQRKLFAKFFEVSLRDLVARIDEEEQGDFRKIAEPIFNTLKTTADVGHFDAFAQVSGNRKNQFSLVGGIKVATFREMPEKFEDLLEFLQQSASDNEPLAKLEIAYDTIDSIPVHRIPSTPTNDGMKRTFGETPSLYLYATAQALWFAFGDEVALSSLKDAVPSVAQPQDPTKNRNRVPLQFVTRAKNWIDLAKDDESQPNSFKKRAEASFNNENDALTIEVRPTEAGLRLRADLQGGFISLLGRGITSGIENGFFNGPRGRRQRETRDLEDEANNNEQNTKQNE